MDAFEKLKVRIDDGEARIGIIGLGYVGLPLAAALHRGGFPVLGFDVDPTKIEHLDRGHNYLAHLGEEMTQELSASARFEATTDFSRLGEADVVIMCVPTPIGAHHEPDLSFIYAAGEATGRTLRSGQLVILESTSFPGTTRDELLPALLKAAPDGHSLTHGEDFFVAYSPEREDPGRQTHSTSTIPKLVGGLDDRSTELATLVYKRAIDTLVPVSSAEIAESAKLLENIFRSVNIALVNEMKVILDAMDINVWEVIEAAATKPFGFMKFLPGPGLGGHCIPIDPFYLSWKAREVDHPTRFIELAGAINTAMPEFVVQKTMLALNEESKAVSGSRILVLGLAYKPNVDDTRESPSFELIEGLERLGAKVDYSDPLIPATKPKRQHDLKKSSVPLTPERLKDYDAVLISTAHDDVDWAMVADSAKLVIDTRNAMAEHESKMTGRLVRA